MTDRGFIGKGASMILSDEQRAHAPRAARVAWVQDLCARSDDGPHICERYAGHHADPERPYRNEHHCECGHGWPDRGFIGLGGNDEHHA